MSVTEEPKEAIYRLMCPLHTTTELQKLPNDNRFVLGNNRYYCEKCDKAIIIRFSISSGKTWRAWPGRKA